MARRSILFPLLVLFGSCLPAPVFAAPVESALTLARQLRSSYAAVPLRDDPKLQGEIIVTDINNQNTVFGYLSNGNLLNPSGGYSSVPSGTGFAVFANGTTLWTSELAGQNFLPFAANDRGEAAGLVIDLSSTAPLTAVVFSPPSTLREINGLPSSTDSIVVSDINNVGTVLLSVAVLVESGSGSTSPRYAQRTFAASPDSAGNYRAAEVAIPPLEESTERFYTPLRAPSRFLQPYEVITGPTATKLTDSGIIYGWKMYGVGFHYSADRGLENLFPGSGSISDTIPTESLSNEPVDLGGNELLLTTRNILSTATGLPVPGAERLFALISSASNVRVDGSVMGFRSEGPRAGDVVIVHPPGVVEDVRCSVPQGTRLEIESPLMMNDAGWAVVQGRYLDRQYTYSPIILIPTPFAKPGAADFCPTIAARFLDRCAEGKNDRGEYFIQPNSRCRLIFDLRDSKNRPIARADAILMNGDGTIVGRARTDSRGRGTFRHRFDPRSGSYSVLAPIRHKHFRNVTAAVTVYGNIPSPYTGGGA